MADVLFELVKALAVRPELLAICVLAGVLVFLLKRRAGSKKKARNGAPIFKLVINRLTQLMMLLVGILVFREMIWGIIAILEQ